MQRESSWLGERKLSKHSIGSATASLESVKRGTLKNTKCSYSPWPFRITRVEQFIIQTYCSMFYWILDYLTTFGLYILYSVKWQNERESWIGKDMKTARMYYMVGLLDQQLPGVAEKNHEQCQDSCLRAKNWTKAFQNTNASNKTYTSSFACT
jgi:hypothetical protein